MDELRSIGVTELLDGDRRPVFILDTEAAVGGPPAYQNASYRHLRGLEYSLSLESTDPRPEDIPRADFWRWAVSDASSTELLPKTSFGYTWETQLIRRRWRVISGQRTHTNLAEHQKVYEREDRNGNAQSRPHELSISQSEQIKDNRDPAVSERVASTFPEDDAVHPQKQSLAAVGPLDLATAYGSPDVTGFLKFFLEFDWSSTIFGPIASWPQDLRNGCNFLLSDPRPAALYWSDQRIVLYNERYARLIGQKHPFMMGKPFNVAWQEILGGFGPVINQVYQTGIATTQENLPFFIQRAGYIEETYFSLSLIPYTTSNSKIACYNPAFDVTRQVIADRRITFLLQLGQHIASSREPKDFWLHLLNGLRDNEFEVPYALLYSARNKDNEYLLECSKRKQDSEFWSLEGTIRVPQRCPHVPTELNTKQPPNEFIPNFQALVDDETPTIIYENDGSLPSELLDGIRSGNVKAGDAAIFFPIRSARENVLGILILGVNPHKRYDADYQSFTQLLSRQLTTSMATAVLLEDEVKRGKLAAEMADIDRNRLAKQLATQAHESSLVEGRFKTMISLAPVGMFHIDPQGVLIYANENYYKITQHPPDSHVEFSWYGVILEADSPIMDVEWAKLLSGETVSFELRLRPPFQVPEPLNGEPTESYTWILAAAYPEKDESGTVTGILGCITDISRQKWAEGEQARKRLEALDLKRQQESFIDMTSHEIRNPLSAIIQCADFISSSLAEYSSPSSHSAVIPRDILESYVDAAQTIMHCGQHQKRIIDDILILSKLNSHLVAVYPVEVQPLVVIKNVLKMFDAELQANCMGLDLTIEQSYKDLEIDWLKLDPSRLLQVLINLTTNAIKFTRSEAEKKINIQVSAFKEHPVGTNEIEYLPREEHREDLSSGPDWGLGETIYLQIEVQDTGRGLDEHERKLLFQRFSQASPRTHVQYGGSGLGLFISRELAEIQGGQIGVYSKAGVGSKFAFYIRARRCAPPSTSSHTTTIAIDPQAQPDAVTNNIAADATVESPKPRPSKGNLKMSSVNRNVLIVEDNIVNQKVLSKQLRTAGCTVYVANHGQEALDFLETSQFWKSEKKGKELPNFICLMDLEMPVMDGLTCMRKIRELQADGIITDHIHVIAVTANARSEQIALAKEAGMDSVVTKPFRIKELIPEMDKLLQTS